jgi:hypothetical protein
VAKPTIPHLDWPVRAGLDGHLVSNEQDSPEDIASCVAVSLLTPPGWRDDEPAFGARPDFPLLPLDLAALAAQVGRDEPRAALILTDDPAARQDLELRVTARISQARGA